MHAVQTIDTRRENVAALIPPARKSEFGQFMTPSRIAGFMVEMFDDFSGRDVRLLDAGAGIGSLTAVFVQRAAEEHPASMLLAAWEIDPVMREHLTETLYSCVQLLSKSGVCAEVEIHPEDFILDACRYVGHMQPPRFTHAILNPPYRKLNSQSMHRKMLRTVDIETSNFYAAFVALSMLTLEQGGELVAITPRSFCNGTYFKPFRRMLFGLAALRRVHVFQSRDHAFRGDDVLQENVIFHLVKGVRQNEVILSSSGDASFLDMSEKRVPFSSMVCTDDEERIIHLPTGDDESKLDDLMLRFPFSLSHLGIGVSTGPVVDFRMKPHLREFVSDGCVPLIYCLHCKDGLVSYPRPSRKPGAIAENDETVKWLMPTGYYVLVRRLSSKEEKRRLVPAVFDPTRVPGQRIGFENHLNVFHENKKGLPALIAKGLAVYLGSTFADKWFRRFNGHTQVNAGDLRTLRYPSRATLELWGRNVGDGLPSQQAIDSMVEG